MAEDRRGEAPQVHRDDLIAGEGLRPTGGIDIFRTVAVRFDVGYFDNAVEVFVFDLTQAASNADRSAAVSSVM